MNVLDIDVPFNCRFTCWFCGEGSHRTVVTTLSTQQINYSVNMPICDECKAYRCHHEANSLVQLRELIKAKIIRRSARELSIGANWTEQELQESDLNGSAFDGFKRSGWPMYLIAKDRVNYNGWPLSIDGIPMESISIEEEFEFDGLTFTSLTSMLDYLSKTFSLNREFLKRVLAIYGDNRAIEAVKFCRLVINNSEFQREKAIDELIESFREQEALALKKKRLDTLDISINIDSIEPVSIRNNTIAAASIYWAMTNGVIDFETLDMLEKDFFESFSTAGDEKVLQLFNALEVYLDKRFSSSVWREKHDPNVTLWQYVESQVNK